MSMGVAKSPLSPSAGLARMSAGHVRQGSVGGGIPKVPSAHKPQRCSSGKDEAVGFIPEPCVPGKWGE